MAVAQADSGQFAAYVDGLFAHQDGLTLVAAREEAARRVGKGRLDTAMKAGEVSRRLESDIELAEQFNVKAVPQIFVRHGRVSGTLGELALQNLLADEASVEP